MEDIVVNRPRYQRRNVTARRRNRKSAGASNAYMERVLRQVLACVAILVAVGIIKSINTPATNFLTGKIKAVMLYNMDLKSAYKSMDGFFKRAAGGGISEAADKAGTQDGADASTKKSPAGESGEISLTAPIEGVVSSPFGMREDPFSGNKKQHTGVDIDAENGDKIKAAADGEVILCSKSKVYGNYIRIKHENGFETLYAHCSKILIQKGQMVKQNDFIGEVGNSGTSTGSHLHFEVIKDGNSIDPMNYIELVPE